MGICVDFLHNLCHILLNMYLYVSMLSSEQYIPKCLYCTCFIVLCLVYISHLINICKIFYYINHFIQTSWVLLRQFPFIFLLHLIINFKNTSLSHLLISIITIIYLRLIFNFGCMIVIIYEWVFSPIYLPRCSQSIALTKITMSLCYTVWYYLIAHNTMNKHPSLACNEVFFFLTLYFMSCPLNI